MSVASGKSRNISSASSHSSRVSAAQESSVRVPSQSLLRAPPRERILLPQNATGKRMLFVGPDSTDSHMVACQKGKYVGFKPASKEISSDCEYLYRPSTGNEPNILMRHQRVNEIGWNVQKLWKGYVPKTSPY